jgi:hypothetical protein
MKLMLPPLAWELHANIGNCDKISQFNHTPWQIYSDSHSCNHFPDYPVL